MQKWVLWPSQCATESHGELRQEVIPLSPPFSPCPLDLSGYIQKQRTKKRQRHHFSTEQTYAFLSVTIERLFSHL